MKFNVGNRVKTRSAGYTYNANEGTMQALLPAGVQGTILRIELDDCVVELDSMPGQHFEMDASTLELVDDPAKATFDATMEGFRVKAQNASRRTNVDKVMGVQTALKMVKVAPDAHLWKPNMTADEARDYILCRVPDLLDMAVFCHYEIGSGSK